MRRYAMLISTTILCLLFLKLTLNYSIRFKEVEHSYESGTSANLIRGSKFAGAISSIENIEEDDAIFLAQQIDEKIDKAVKLSRLSDLNKRVWQLSSTIIERDGSAGLKRRLKKSEELLGQDDEYQKVKNQELTARTMPSDTTIRGTGIITVKVHTLTDNNVSENCHGVLVDTGIAPTTELCSTDTKGLCSQKKKRRIIWKYKRKRTIDSRPITGSRR